MTPAPKLTADQARKIAHAEVAVAQLEAQLAIAKTTRDALRTRYLPRIPASSDPAEAAKGIRSVTVGGIIIRVARAVSGQNFSLARYAEAGHALTAAMREAITPGKAYDRWTVKNEAGPYKPGSVEPS